MGRVGPVAPPCCGWWLKPPIWAVHGRVAGSRPQTRYGAFFVVAMPTPWVGVGKGCNRRLWRCIFGLVRTRGTMVLFIDEVWSMKLLELQFVRNEEGSNV